MKQNRIIPILDIGQFESAIEADDFYSNEFEKHIIRNRDMIFKPHSHNFFLCVIFTEGSGVHEIDFNKYDIKAGSVFFLKPGQMHYWKFDIAPKGYIFFHTKDFYELCWGKPLSQFPFYFTQENPPYIKLDSSETNRVKELFKVMYIEYKKEEVYKLQKLNSLINLIYINLSRFYSIGNQNNVKISKTYLRLLEKLQETLEVFYKTEKSPKFYAEKLFITTKHLNRVTQSTVGKTCSSIIKERVLLEAKRLLVHSNDSLSSISELLGFEDYSYFSKIFKTNVGVTPFDFRKRY